MSYLHLAAKPWSPRDRPISPRESLYQRMVRREESLSIEVPEIKLEEPPKIVASRQKPLYAEMVAKQPDDSLQHSAPFQGAKMVASIPSPIRISSIEEIEARYEHDPYDGNRRDYGNHRLDEIALSVYEDMKNFETFARRIVALPRDSFYELQVIRYMVDTKYRYYQRILHRFVMGKVRNLVEYYMREFANAYNPVFIDWFNQLQGFMTEDAYVRFPYITHFHENSFNQFIYRELMGIIMKLRERIHRVDQHLISPIPSEFIMNSHYNNVKYMWNEEQLNYIHDNLYKIYNAVGKLIDHKISFTL